jgi:plastocyanin
MNSSALWVVAGVIVVAGLGFWAYSMQQPAGNVQNNTTITPGANTGSTGAPQDGVGVGVGVDAGIGDASTPATTATVLYGTNGFSETEVVIKKGGSVTWTNNGGGNMWVASAQHPTHTTYSGTTLAQHCPSGSATAFDQCANGTTYSFKFDKVGSWPYHNHSNPSHFGKVIVVE